MTPNIVNGEGPLTSCEIAIVGEAPGYHENRLGRPFVGPSGDLLNECLHAAGLSRDQIYVTNIIKERPINNDISRFIRPGKWISPAGKVYIEIFEEEMRKCSANIIVAVGNVAMWVLTHHTQILKRRGSLMVGHDGLNLMPHIKFSGRKILPIIHPAATMHHDRSQRGGNYIWTYLIKHDLRRARKWSKDRKLWQDSRNYILLPTWQQITDYLDVLASKPLVAFDIECPKRYGKEIQCISFAWNAQEAISVPLMYQDREYLTADQETEFWLRVGGIMENPDIAKVAQNTPFDATYLFRKYGIKSVNLHDTMVAHAINLPDLNNRQKGKSGSTSDDRGGGCSLAFLTSWYTDMPYYKDDGREAFKTGVSGGVDEVGFHRYNARDSIVLMEIFPEQLKELEELGNLEAYEHQRRLLEPGLYMTARGIRMDENILRRSKEAADVEVARMRTELDALAGQDLFGKTDVSAAKLKKFFYEDYGITPYLDQKTGNPTTNVNALKRIAAKGLGTPSQVASLVLRIRKHSKMSSTYYDVNLSPDHRLRCSLSPTAESGRFRSYKTYFGEGMNMQNQPKIMKKYMFPDEGYVAVAMDLQRAETWVVAHDAEEPIMMQALRSGVDLHKRTAMPIFDVDDIEDITWDDDDPAHRVAFGTGQYAMRYWGKRANHALAYDMSYVRAALLWECSQRDAKIIIERYHSLYSGIRLWHQRIRSRLHDNRQTLTNLMGTKRMFLESDRNGGHDLYKPAYSWMAQSTVANKINRHGLELVYYGGELMAPAELLMQVHDSIEFQMPLAIGWDHIAEIILTIKRSLEQPLEAHGRQFSIPVDIKLLPRNLGQGPEFKGGTEWNDAWWETGEFAKTLSEAYMRETILTT